MAVVASETFYALDSTKWWARKYVWYSEITHSTFSADVRDDISIYVLYVPCRAALPKVKSEVRGDKALAFSANKESFRGKA